MSTATELTETTADDSDFLSAILLRCLHQDIRRFPGGELAQLSPEQWVQLKDLAIEHRVAPLLYHRLSKQDAFPAASSTAREALNTYAKRVAFNNLVYSDELHKVVDVLNRHNIPVVLLKGMYLAEFIYESKGLREMNDIDILVPKSGLERAAEAVMETGYKPAKPMAMKETLERSHHLPPMLNGKAALEIHWNLTKPGKAHYTESEEFLQRAPSHSLDGRPVYALAPEDLLLHLCIHTSYQHLFSFGLRPFCDIAEVINHYSDSLDWQVIIQRAESLQWSNGVALALYTAQNFVGANVPENVIERLAPLHTLAEYYPTARAQILTPKTESQAVSPSMIDFATDNSLSGKLRTVSRRIFLPADMMVTMYPVSHNSPLLYWYYGVRFVQTVLRHTTGVFKILKRDKTIKGIVHRKKSLHEWMNA